MSRKHVGLIGLVLAGLLVSIFFAPADVDVVSGATRKKKTTTKTRPEYFFLVVRPDGSSEIKTMTLDAAKASRSDMLKQYAELKKEWRKFAKEWAKGPDAGPCPVPLPKMYKCQQLARASSKDAARARVQKKYDRMLNQWSICTATNHAGESETVVLRRDQVLGARRGLLLDYARAMVAARGDTEATAAIKKPTFKIVRNKLPSKEDAERVLDELKAAAAAKDDAAG